MFCTNRQTSTLDNKKFECILQNEQSNFDGELMRPSRVKRFHPSCLSFICIRVESHYVIHWNQWNYLLHYFFQTRLLEGFANLQIYDYVVLNKLHNRVFDGCNVYKKGLSERFLWIILIKISTCSFIEKWKIFYCAGPDFMLWNCVYAGLKGRIKEFFSRGGDKIFSWALPLFCIVLNVV